MLGRGVLLQSWYSFHSTCEIMWGLRYSNKLRKMLVALLGNLHLKSNDDVVFFPVTVDRNPFGFKSQKMAIGC